VENNRQLPGCQEKPSVIFCDNCSCHCSDDVLRDLATHGILLMTYPPHSSHIFQVLDVLLFGRLKSAKYLARDPNLSPQVDHAMRVFRAYEQATTSTTVQGSWQKASFGFVMRSGTRYLWVDKANICGSPDCLELWVIDDPEVIQVGVAEPRPLPPRISRPHSGPDSARVKLTYSMSGETRAAQTNA
jgi:hypothetical protein